MDGFLAERLIIQFGSDLSIDDMGFVHNNRGTNFLATFRCLFVRVVIL